jgi:DNA topoisomerase-1
LKPPDELTVEAAMELLLAATKEPEALGDDPETGKPVFLKIGRFGPYVQLGVPVEGSDEKPKMASLLPNSKPEDVNLEHALELLSLPRSVGMHPDDQKEVIATNGRFGPYVKWGEEIRSIPADENSPLTITLEAAVELLKQPKGRGRAAKPASLRDVGKHPVSEKNLVVMSGRFGPYVTDGEINASLRKGMTPENLTVDDAVELLEARAARIAEGGGAPARRPARKKAAPKKAAKKAAKKSSKKKVAAKKAAAASADGDEGVEEKAS